MQMYQNKIIEVEMKWGQCIPDNCKFKTTIENYQPKFIKK
jgi:hypothetical protein